MWKRKRVRCRDAMGRRGAVRAEPRGQRVALLDEHGDAIAVLEPLAAGRLRAQLRDAVLATAGLATAGPEGQP